MAANFPPEVTELGDAARYVDHIFAILERIQLFEDFDRDEIVVLARYLRCYLAPAGTAIIREDEEGDFMVLIVSGQLEIVKRDASGIPKRIGVAGPGKTLGEMSMVDGEPRFATCIALEDTVFAVLDRDHLSRIIADQPQLGIKLLMELVLLLSQRLRVTTAKLVKHLDAEPEN
ncbi:MAG: cyclic nucleotide-binding domain-containing protein [Pseudomonadota bacterium]